MNAVRQAGNTLVSTLVGLVLGLVTVGAMLMTYQTTVSVSVEATRSAIREGQLASAFLAAQIELQQAGFGMESTEGVNIVVDQSDRRIVWRYRTGASMVCSGLQLVVGTAADGIYRLRPLSCTTPVGKSATLWNGNGRQLLASSAALFEPSDTEEKRNYNVSTAIFELVPNQDCGPFGINGGVANRTLVVLKDTAPNPDVTIFSYCLTNT